VASNFYFLSRKVTKSSVTEFPSFEFVTKHDISQKNNNSVICNRDRLFYGSKYHVSVLMAETVWLLHIQMHIFRSVANTAVHAMWKCCTHNARRLTDLSEMIKRITLFSSLRVRSNLYMFLVCYFTMP